MIEKERHHKSAIRVVAGIDQPASVNPEAAKKLRKTPPEKRPVGEYLQGIINGNRTLLSQAITLAESSLPRHQEIAQQIIAGCVPLSGNSIRVGITGVPGAGKSTFIEALGKYLTEQGHKMAVLAIDPSSQRTKGSILGDKTRMEDLANNPNAFIRPSSSAGTLGGVARSTRETMILCEAAGYDVIIVETVGVGQSETAVHSMVDFFLLLMIAGAGDELQGIKRGIMEMADAIVINKADGDNIPRTEMARREFINALHLFPPAPSGWVPEVLTASSTEGKGIKEIWDLVQRFQLQVRESGYFELHRREQSLQAFMDATDDVVRQRFYNHQEVVAILPGLKADILGGKISPYAAAQVVIARYLGE